MKIERVALIGLGAIGSFFAPRLYKELGAEDFWIVAEGERKERLERKGVILNGTNYKFPVIEPRTEGKCADLIVIAVKGTELDQAIADIRNQVGEHTLIMSVLNGIESEERVADVYGWKHVLYSFMRVSIAMDHGVADYDPDGGFVHFGEKNNEQYSERVEAVRELFDRCGIPYKINTDMLHGMWFKFMANVGENMTSALLGIPFGAYRTMEDANAIRRAAMWEVAAIANKKGIKLGEREMEKQEKVLQKLPECNKPSTLQDLERGRKTEVEMFSGAVVRLGRELGIETPVNQILYHGIKVLEEKNKK